MDQTNTQEIQKCTDCGVVLIIGETITEKAHKIGKRTCRLCSNKRCRDYKLRQNELAKSDSKAQWWRVGRLVSSRISKFKKNTKKAGLNIPCDDYEVIMAHLRDIFPVLPTKCPAMEIDLSYKAISTYDKKQSPHAVSIDRIDSDKGYVIDNIQILSLKANIIKSDSNCEEIFKLFKFTCETQKQKMKEVLEKYGFVFFSKNNSEKTNKKDKILEKRGECIPVADIQQYEFKFSN